MHAELANVQTPPSSSSPQKVAAPPGSADSATKVVNAAPAAQDDGSAQLGKQGPASNGPAPLKGAPQPRGSFKVGTADEAGNMVETATTPPKADPSSKRARVLVFEIDSNGPQPPSKEQLELQVKIEQVLHAARTVYPAGDPDAESTFRLHFVSLYNAARWGLEGVVATDQAKGEVNRIEGDLIEDAAGPIKNSHLRLLALWGALLSIPFIVAFLVLHLSTSQAFVEKLRLLGVDHDVLANFMLLWIGCFIGVCLSYALRTVVPTLADLTATDKDYLRPSIRLVFAGALTMLLALFSVVGLVDIKIGTYALSQVASNAMLAFVVGAICGISELALPGTVGKKAGGLIASDK